MFVGRTKIDIDNDKIFVETLFHLYGIQLVVRLQYGHPHFTNLRKLVKKP